MKELFKKIPWSKVGIWLTRVCTAGISFVIKKIVEKLK